MKGISWGYWALIAGQHREHWHLCLPHVSHHTCRPGLPCSIQYTKKNITPGIRQSSPTQLLSQPSLVLCIRTRWVNHWNHGGQNIEAKAPRDGSKTSSQVLAAAIERLIFVYTCIDILVL